MCNSRDSLFGFIMLSYFIIKLSPTLGTDKNYIHKNADTLTSQIDIKISCIIKRYLLKNKSALKINVSRTSLKYGAGCMISCKKYFVRIRLFTESHLCDSIANILIFYQRVDACLFQCCAQVTVIWYWVCESFLYEPNVEFSCINCV